ncbi:MAG: hypothetical protein U0670_19595 [Anaerolineae bacterium]
MSSKPLAERQQALMRTLDFTEEDLAHNEAGELSPSQRAFLEEGRVLAIAGFGVALILVTVWVSHQPRTGLPINLLIMSVPLIGLIFYLDRSRRFAASGKIAVVEGTATVTYTYLRRGAGFYTLAVHGKVFSLSRAMVKAFENGEKYRIYYRPDNKMIFSALALEDG